MRLDMTLRVDVNANSCRWAEGGATWIRGDNSQLDVAFEWLLHLWHVCIKCSGLVTHSEAWRWFFDGIFDDCIRFAVEVGCIYCQYLYVCVAGLIWKKSTVITELAPATMETSTWKWWVVRGLLEDWIIIIDVNHSNRESRLCNVCCVWCQNPQLELLSVFVIELLLENYFPAELVNWEECGCAIVYLLELSLVVRFGQETVCYGRIGVNIICRHCRQNRPKLSP